MADQELTKRDAKLIQYLNEAYGNEKGLVTALEAHIEVTTRMPYKKRLREHLRETKRHARELERRIKQLGGRAEAVPAPGPDAVAEAASGILATASRAVELAKGPLHAIRGTSEQERMLKNAKTEYWNEAEEIATYRAIIQLAESVHDRETAKIAKGILRDEERMQKFLERLIPQLTKAVVTEEIPASERRKNGRKPRRRTAAKRTTSGSAKASSRGKAGATAKSRSGSAAKSRAGSAAKSRSAGAAKSRSGAAAKSRPATAKSRSGSTAKSRSGGARSRSGSKSNRSRSK